MDAGWAARAERERRECEERERCFQQTLARAKQQASAFRQIAAEDEHASRRHDMRAAYTQHGAEFDPCQIQAPSGPTRNYQAITGHSPPSYDTCFPRPPSPTQQAAPCQNIGPPQTMMPSRRTASEMLQTSPPRQRSPPRTARSPADMVMTPPVTRQRGGPACDDMEMTPTVTRGAVSQPDVCSPVSEHQALLERVRRTLAQASRTMNIDTSSAPHPLSYGFSNPPPPPTALPRRPPLADLTRAHQGVGLPPTCPVDQPPPRTCPTAGPPPSRGVPRAAPPGSPHAGLGAHPDLPPPRRLRPPSGAGAAAAAGPPPTRGLPRSAPSDSPTRGPCVSRSQSRTRPTEASVRAAVAAGTLKGTTEEMEAIGFKGDRCPFRGEMLPEWEFAEQNIQSYEGSPPVCEFEDLPETSGILRDQGEEEGRKFRVMLKRKVVKITIPPRPDPEAGITEEHPLMTKFKYEPTDPCYGVREGELLPPRRLTPSPPNTCYQAGQPRTKQQMQARRDLEADWERREAAVPSRAYPGDKRPANKPLPKAYTTGKPKKHKYYRGGAQANEPPLPTPSTSFGMAMGGTGRPQTPTTRTGLVLRTPSTPTSTRSGSAPPRRCVRPTSGRSSSAGSARPPPVLDPARDAPSPTRGTMRDDLGNIGHDVSGRLDRYESRGLDAARDLPQVVSEYAERGFDYTQSQLNRLQDPMSYVDQGLGRLRSEIGHPVDAVREGFRNVRGRLERIGNLAMSRIKDTEELAKNIK